MKAQLGVDKTTRKTTQLMDSKVIQHR